ncbi:zf-HC2 domain-containing protein [Rummeliibacillus sp. TYF-LIM-RU47]|uniref:zf-HC2 domain-containing protein n=1 Tax=Rummeliibacillus sp. TYF-LIM-RU47 TaxID=2608406 RepID=UPI001239FAEB|nr:zf-HC2 domain-containing protein [Rummeliibacillus sp. TYF-LIM-RU47]
MNTCPKEIVQYMHEYLDGDIASEHEQELQKHLYNCSDCRKHMQELEDTIAIVKGAIAIATPPRFVDQVMQRLPRRKMKYGFQRFIRRHPIAIAAALFCIFMSASFLSGYKNDQQFSYTKQPNLQVEGQTVIVPEGETIKGDLLVKNGDILVKGAVDGDITVINGKYMASSANVTGQIEEIDEMFEWLWYKIKNSAKKAWSIIDNNE